jgi:molybdopterin adenylyltransferase
MGTKAHKADAPGHLTMAVVSVSTTRTLANDKSGHWIGKRAKKEGHTVVFHQVVTDDAETITSTILDIIREHHPHAILLTGGTGISERDVTIEAIHPLLDKEMTAFGPIFAQLSFQEIDSAAIMSRATAGVIRSTAIFCIPGSLKACQLACKALIFPELGHVARHIHKG